VKEENAKIGVITAEKLNLEAKEMKGILIDKQEWYNLTFNVLFNMWLHPF